MLDIVLDYDMGSDLKEMQTITAQDIRTFVDARDFYLGNRSGKAFRWMDELEGVF